MVRRLAALVCLLASGLALAGCVSIQGISSEQQDIVGKLRLTVSVCATGEVDGVGGDEDHPGCSVFASNYGAKPGSFPYPANGERYQVLFAVRVPVGAGMPDVVSAVPSPAPPAVGTIVARRNGSYGAALEAAFPAPGSTRWVGYLSDPYDFSDGADNVPAQSGEVVVELTLPPTADGGPFVGPLQVRPVVGARIAATGSLTPDRPVECGADPLTASSDFTVCVDSPTEAVVEGLPYPLQTRDFGIVAGNATASPGQTVALPFNVRGAGALPAGLSAALSASTSLPGVAVAPSAPSAALANGSDTRVTVPVAIPAGAAAGTYEVVLTGRLENGQERRGVAELTVRARPEAPNVKPVLSGLRLKPKAFKPATKRKPKRGTDVAYTLSEAASVSVVVERCSKYAKPKRKGKAKGKRSVAEAAARRKRRAAARGRCVSFKAMSGAQVKAGKAGANGFRFNGKVAGRALKPGAHRLALTPTDAAGARGAAVRAAFTIAR